MSAIDEFAANESAKIDTMSAAIVALDKSIQEFDESPGVLTPNDQALLTAIRTRSATLVAMASSASHA
jgi:hypothetical protein